MTNKEIINRIEDSIFFDEGKTLIQILSGEDEPDQQQERGAFDRLAQLIDAGEKPPKGLKERFKAYTPDFYLPLNPPMVHKKVKQVAADDHEAILRSLKDCVSKNEIPPALCGVHLDGGAVVATDGHKLVALGRRYPEELEGKTLLPADNKTLKKRAGEEIEEKYPNWRAVIPEYASHTDAQNLDRLIAICNARVQAARWFNNDVVAYVRVTDTFGVEIYLNAKVLLPALIALRANGVEEVEVFNGNPKQAVIFKDTKSEDFALCMPMICEGQGAISDLVNESI